MDRFPEYEKILKHIVEEFLAEFELYDYETENNRDVKKEIRKHFKFFKDPEFGKLITKVMQSNYYHNNYSIFHKSNYSNYGNYK